MATVSLSAISAIMNLIYQEIMNSQIRTDVLIPNLVRVRTVGVDEQPNKTDTWTVKFSNRSAGGAFAEGADMADGDYDSHTRKEASHAWAQYRKGAKVSGLAEALSAFNGGVPQSLFSDEISDATHDLAVDLSVDTYAGDVSASPAELDGLAVAIDNAGIYAGLNRATYAEWKATEDTHALASLSFSALRSKLHQAIHDGSGRFPQVAFCSSTIYNAIGDLFGSERRYVDEIPGADGKMVNLKALSGGYRALDVDGVYYMIDRHATDDTIYAAHLSAIEYVQVPAVAPQVQAAEVVAAAQMLTGTKIDRDEVLAKFAQGTTRLQPYIQAIAPTGDAFKAMVKWYGQLRVRHPNRTGKLTLT